MVKKLLRNFESGSKSPEAKKLSVPKFLIKNSVKVIGRTNLAPKNSHCFMAENLLALPGHTSPEHFKN